MFDGLEARTGELKDITRPLREASEVVTAGADEARDDR